MSPLNAIAAASHSNPYPYYQRLLNGPPLYFDADLHLWIASREAVIRAVLDEPHCRVRPMAEPVPRTIAGSSAGTVFASLMRMNEGIGHGHPRRAIGPALAALDLTAVANNTGRLAHAAGGSAWLAGWRGHHPLGV